MINIMLFSQTVHVFEFCLEPSTIVWRLCKKQWTILLRIYWYSREEKYEEIRQDRRPVSHFQNTCKLLCIIVL